ncbi:MAG: EamA family transporter [Gammaproteobacteria bacterium]|nr:EamA family transporter [Gammaproteobacteria bacterium]
MKHPARALMALVVMSLLWGYGWTAIKIGLLDAPPFKLTAVRMLASALCLMALLPLTGRPLAPQRLPELTRLALVQTSLLFTLSTWAVAHGSAGRVAFMVYTMPFFTLLLAWPLLGERVRGAQWLAVVLAAAGLVAIIQPWALGDTLASSVLGLGGGMAWAVGAILVKRLQRRAPMDLLCMTAWQMLLGCVPLMIIALWVDEPAIVWSPRFIGILTLMAVVITAFGWMLWMYALDNLDTGTAGLATLLTPTIAMVSSHYTFGEQPGRLELLGMGLITLALLSLSGQGLWKRRAAMAAL